MVELDPEALAARLDEIVKELGSGRRARKCAQALRVGAARIGADEHETLEQEKEFALAFQDGALIVGAWDGLIRTPELPRGRNRLRKALKGATIEVPEKENDEPRDRLWELYLAACFRNQGFPVEFGDEVCDPADSKPDLFVTADGTRLAVEAKRVRGNTLEARVGEAVEQISSACAKRLAVAGFVAIDLSFMLGEHPQRRGPRHLPDSGAYVHLRQELEPKLEEYGRRVRSMVSGRGDEGRVVGTTIMSLPSVILDDIQRRRMIRHFLTAIFESNRPPQEAVRALQIIQKHCFGDGVRLPRPAAISATSSE